jgi:hypothetical protein
LKRESSLAFSGGGDDSFLDFHRFQSLAIPTRVERLRMAQYSQRWGPRWGRRIKLARACA